MKFLRHRLSESFRRSMIGEEASIVDKICSDNWR